MATIGRRNRLSIERSSGPGLYLNGGGLGEILLPGRYIPADVKPGDQLDVFVYLDSEDRLVATTEIPKVMVGEFACLKVVGVHPKAGAFLDWGLSKDLLLPFPEQEKPVRTGTTVAVYVYLDERSRRIVASARLKRHLNQSGDTYQEKQPVNLLIIGETPLGYNAIVNNDRLGLLYHNTLGIPLSVGERMRGYVRVVRADGKLDLSLDQAGYSRVLPLKLRIVSALKDNGGKLDLDDDSPPLVIREKFQCSKNAFKLALAALYKSRRIEFTRPGIRLLDNTTFTPGR
jgi:predicted RNA-binding protein (virulence factor B family)